MTLDDVVTMLIAEAIVEHARTWRPSLRDVRAAILMPSAVDVGPCWAGGGEMAKMLSERDSDGAGALPVPKTCGKCGYRALSRIAAGEDGVIRVCTNVYPSRETNFDSAPPRWCPLRGKR